MSASRDEARAADDAMEDWQIEASAPGKIVLTGEYAVLVGAPALVAAVDRRVTCRLALPQTGGWRITTRGFASDVALSKADVFGAPPNTIAGVVARLLGERAAPDHARIAIDSSACHSADGRKLGIGSSAAALTALAVALRALDGRPPALSELIDLHAGFQGGGSGLDVAAAFVGGVIRYQNRRAAPARLPQGLSKQVVWCGAGTSTSDRLAAFNAWRAGGLPRALDRLAAAADVVSAHLGDAERFVAAYGEYADELDRFDRAAKLGVFGPRHRRVHRVAVAAGVEYKPCGAGGDDVGLALAADQAALTKFADALGAAAGGPDDDGIEPLDIDFATDGVRLRKR